MSDSFKNSPGFHRPRGSQFRRTQFRNNNESWSPPFSGVENLGAFEQSFPMSPSRKSVPCPTTTPVEVVVSHFFSPDEFYLQYYNYQEDLRKMMVGVQRAASSSYPPRKRLFPGELYFARTSANSLWYRVEILNFYYVNREERVDFKFIDYGHRETVVKNWRDTFRIITDEKHRETSNFAFKASLADVFSPNSDGSYPKADHIVTNQRFFVEIVENGLVKSVKLTYPNGQNLASVFFREGVVKLASDIVPPSLNKPSGSRDYSELNDTTKLNPSTSTLESQQPNHLTLMDVQQAMKAIIPPVRNPVTEEDRLTNLAAPNKAQHQQKVTPTLNEDLNGHKIQATNTTVSQQELNVTSTNKSLPNHRTLGVEVKSLKATRSSEDQQPEELVENNILDQIVEEKRNGSIARAYINAVVSSQFTVGCQHPDLIIEASSLANITLPEIPYHFALPKKTIKSGSLSKMQLETIIYITQKHESILPGGSRAGFLLGDGPGVGKGRTLAGLIFENYLRGFENALWISASDDAQENIEQDFHEIVAKPIMVHALKKIKHAAKINSSVETGVLFSTYSSLIGKKGSRLKQLLEWLGKDFNGVIVFDDFHRATELLFCLESDKFTDLGLTILELQSSLPKARIVYSSSTGSLNPHSFAFMVRLGLWGPTTSFKGSDSFIHTIQKYGQGVMEVMTMELKRQGMFISRQLSFKDVAFNVDVVPLPRKFIKVYDDSCKLWIHLLQSFTKAADHFKINKTKRKAMWTEFWSAHRRFFQLISISPKINQTVKLAKKAVKSGKCVVINLQTTEEHSFEQTEIKLFDFLSTAKGILENLVLKHFPEPHRLTADEDETILLQNKEEVINLESDEDNNATDCWKRKATCVNMGPVRKRKKESDSIYIVSDSESNEHDNEEFFGKNVDSTFDNSSEMTNLEKTDDISLTRRQLLINIGHLGVYLPPCPIDELIHQLGGFKNVAEITSRKGRILKNCDNQTYYEWRWKSKLQIDVVNRREKQSFMDGDKMFAIISEGASSGLSLQAGKCEKNQRQRVYITLELPSNAEKIIEQFGRAHRTNQVSAPELIIMVSDLTNEIYFASVVAKRLISLGAHPLHGRQTIESKGNTFEVDLITSYGREALDVIVKAACGDLENLLVPPPINYNGDFIKDVHKALVQVGHIPNKTDSRRSNRLALNSNHNNVLEFLNRHMWGISLNLQNSLFQYLIETASIIFNNAKASGSCNQGIFNLASSRDDVQRTGKRRTFAIQGPTGSTEITLQTFIVDYGIDWLEAEKQFASSTEETSDGFYLTTESENRKPSIFLAQRVCVDVRKESKLNQQHYAIFNPSSGLQSRQLSLAEIMRKSRKVDADVAKPIWNDIYSFSKDNCLHTYWYGNCENSKDINCRYGIRQHTYHVLSGSLLSVWTKIEPILRATLDGKIQFVQIFNGDIKTVGILVCARDKREVINFYKKECAK